MVLESWESILGNQNVPLFAQRTSCERLKVACTKVVAAELMNVSGLWDLNEQKVEEFLCLLVFGVLEVKDGLDRTGKKIDTQQQKLHALE